MKAKYVLFGIGGLFGLVFLWVVSNTFGTGMRLVSETMRTENIIATYEEFHDRCAVIVGYENSIAAQEALVDEAESSKERTRIRANIAGITAQRARAIAQYNADATKTNVGIFQGQTLPKRLDANAETTICGSEIYTQNF